MSATLDGVAQKVNAWQAMEQPDGSFTVWRTYSDGQSVGAWTSLEDVARALRKLGGAYELTAYVLTGDGSKYRWHSTQASQIIPPSEPRNG